MEEKQNNNNFLVGIRCFTYNQSLYITDALNGFTMQQTTFPYVAMVVDDASTDGEQEVIAKYVKENFDIKNSDVAYKKETDYAHITFAQHKTNKNCYIAVLYLKENHYRKKSKFPYLSEWRDNTKYEALCEGDDYWIDPLKLQKQVDFLETHPDHSLCFHAHIVEFNESLEYHSFHDNNIEVCIVRDLILADADAMATNSMLFKRSLSSEYKKWAKELSFEDFPLELTLAELGYVGYINDNMSIYRLQSLGSWSSSNKSLKIQIKNRKERLKMWKQYDKWTDGKYSIVVARMYMLDIIRLCMLNYMKIFNIKDSKLYKALRWIYRKSK